MCKGIIKKAPKAIWTINNKYLDHITWGSKRALSTKLRVPNKTKAPVEIDLLGKALNVKNWQKLYDVRYDMIRKWKGLWCF